MTSDDQPNLPAVPEVHQATVVHALEIPVAEFEGEMVRVMIGTLPRESLTMDYGYRRGTHLKLELEVEVMKVSVDEVKSGEMKGELFREHTLKIRDAKILGAYTADQLDPGVGGSAAVGAPDPDESPEGDPDDGSKPHPDERPFSEEFPDF